MGHGTNAVKIQNGQLERLDWKAYKETQYNKLAEIIRESLDMEYIYQILGKGTRMP